MWPTWKMIPAGWHHVMQVMLLSVALFVSTCTASGHSSSTPSALYPKRGYAGAEVSGNGGDGYWNMSPAVAGHPLMAAAGATARHPLHYFRSGRWESIWYRTDSIGPNEEPLPW